METHNNMILLSIPNEIYNSVDSCKTAKEMWDRVERLMRGTIQNQVDRETRFTNEFDQFVAEPGESLVSVYNLPFGLELTVDSFDDLFDYLSQFEKLVNTSRAKKLEKSHDPLALVAHTGSSSRNTSSYYVTHPPSVVDYDEEFEQDDVHNHSEDPLASAMLLLAKAITQNFSNPTNNRLRASSNTRNQAVVQGDRVNIQAERILTANVQRIVRTPTPGNTSTGQCYNCGGKGHYARNYPKPRVRDSKYFMEQMLLANRLTGLSVEDAFVSEVQSSSINENDEQMYPTHTKIINSTIDDDQINSNIQFDSVKGNVNSGSIEKDTHVS
ncbi:retrovirus-related pol polyprotein from transposon TNT 1-94 [Tanacetum coccineum]